VHEVHIGVIDWIVLGGYLLAVATIGIVALRRTKSSENYFMGERKFGIWTMIAQSFGTGTHAEMPVSLAGAVYGSGLSAIWFQWKNLFATPFYWLMAPIFRRFRRATLAEVVADRYGSWMGVCYTLFALAFIMLGTASLLKGAAKAIDEAIGGMIPVNGLLIGMTVLFMLYSFLGGILATAWTDVLQGILIIVLSFLVVPLGWKLVGGLHGMKATLGADRFSLVIPHGIGPWFIAMLTLNGLIGILAQPQQVAAVATGKDEHTCRIGQFYGNFVKRICTVGWAIVGLIAATLVARKIGTDQPLADPELAFGFACRQLLFPGGVGLLAASFLAASMAASSAFMVDSGALFTNGLYRKHLAPGASDQNCLWVGRVSGLIITLLSIAYAIWFIDKVLYSFLLAETMAAYVGIGVLGGIVWPRANRWGALASVLVSVGVNFVCYAARGQRLDSWEPNTFCCALCAGIIVLVVVSLATPPEPMAATAQFFLNMKTPVDAGSETLTLESERQAASEGKQLILVNLLHLRRGAHGYHLWRAYRRDLKGFAIGCGLILVLVLGLQEFSAL